MKTRNPISNSPKPATPRPFSLSFATPDSVTRRRIFPDQPVMISQTTGTGSVQNRCGYSDLSAVGGLTSLFQRGSLAGMSSVIGTRKAFASITISRSETPRSPVSMWDTVDRPISNPRTEQRAARSSCVSPPSFRSRQTCLPTMLRTFPSSIVKLAYRKESRPRVCWWYASRLFWVADQPETITLRSVMPAMAAIPTPVNPASHRRPWGIFGIFPDPLVPNCVPVEYSSRKIKILHLAEGSFPSFRDENPLHMGGHNKITPHFLTPAR